jgi:hypothetical protein
VLRRSVMVLVMAGSPNVWVWNDAEHSLAEHGQGRKSHRPDKRKKERGHVRTTPLQTAHTLVAVPALGPTRAQRELGRRADGRAARHLGNIARTRCLSMPT